MYPKSKHRLLKLLVAASLLAVGAMTVGCSSASEEEEEDSPSEDALADVRALAGEGLPIFTSESPSGGATFNFCTKPSASAPLNLTNAAWLSMMSANEYGHLGYLAPQLIDMGFGSKGDSKWVECGGDLGKVRDFELVNEIEVKGVLGRGPAALVSYFREPTRVGRFGACAKTFLEQRYTGASADGKAELPGVSLRDDLMRETRNENYIQFLSAKPYTFLEKLMSRGSAQAVIARHGTKPMVFVAFRGTEPPNADQPRFRQIIDLITDLDIYRTDTTNYGFSPGWGSVHRGFVQSFAALNDEELGRALTRRLRAITQDDPDVGIWITGHSLGGALATLMTARLLDLKDQGIPIALKGMYTFGSPMVGNDVFKKKFEESAAKHGVALVRFRNDQDVITQVPALKSLLGSLFNYHHAGRLALLNTTIETPPVEPAYTSLNLDDHDIAGIVGPPGNRTRKSGYYSKISTLLRNNARPDLTACDAR